MKRLIVGVVLAVLLASVPAHAFYFKPTPWYHRYCERMWNRGDRIGVYLASWSGC